MLKRFRLLILVLMAILWFVIILPYFLLQTEIGARYGSKLISHYSDNYTISVGSISHSIFKPYEIELQNISIQDKSASTTYLTAQKVSIVLKKDDLLQTKSLDYLFIENGYIQPSTTITNPNIDINVLLLKNISLTYPNKDPNEVITLKNMSGTIAPWSTAVVSNRLESQFSLTIGQAKYNQINMQSIVLQGKQQNNTLDITNFGGKIKHGFFTLKANLLSDNSLNISQLWLNNINVNTELGNSTIHKLTANLSKVTIEQLSVINSSIATPELTIEKGNLEAKNIEYTNRWQLARSDLAFNAQSVVWRDELIEKPLLKWHYDKHKIILDQAIASWNKGDFKLSGSWQPQQLIIDNIIAGGVRYQLPLDWYQSLTTIKLTDFLATDYLPSNIVVKKFTLMPSLIIDTNPYLPFQFTAFEAFGNNVIISPLNDKVNISGSLLIKADSGTLNSVELNKPDLTLNLSSGSNDLSFSSLISQGIIEGKANLSTNNQLHTLTLSAHTVDSQILTLWHLITNPIESTKYTLELQGNLQPLSLDGWFKTDEKSYSIKNNQLNDY